MEEKAVIELVNDLLVLKCSGCKRVLKTEKDLSEEELRLYIKGQLPPQTCNTAGVECKRFE